MPFRDFWQDAPRESRAALVCAALFALYYPASFAGLRLESGVGNWGTLAALPLLVVGWATTRRAIRLQRAAWRLSDHGRSSGIMTILEARPPARPRLLGGLLALGVALAVAGELVAGLLRASALPGATTRMAAVCGLTFGVLLARRADTLARRERALARREAAVAA